MLKRCLVAAARKLLAAMAPPRASAHSRWPQDLAVAWMLTGLAVPFEVVTGDSETRPLPPL